MTRRFHPPLWGLVLCLGMLAASPTLAQDDYDTAGGDWNGLSDFLAAARLVGVNFELHDDLDYDTLKTQEPIVIFYPTRPLRVESLANFAIDGGRIVLADDFGQSTGLLERLDLSRIEPVQGTLPHKAFVQDNPALPLLQAKGVHPLLEGVGHVVANHPAVLYNVGGAVLSYSEDGGLVYDMNLGAGKVIVSADPSMFINHMLLLGDNAQFARNVLQYACQDKNPCKAHLFVGDFAQRGSYGADSQADQRRQVFESIRDFNESLDAWMKELPGAQLLYYCGLLLALGLLLYLCTIFPLRRTQPYSSYLEEGRQKIHPPQSEFDWNLARFAGGTGSMNHALPVSILKELFEELFLDALGVWEVPPPERPKIPELIEIFKARTLDLYSPEESQKVENALRFLLGTFAQVPTRHRVFLDSDTYFSERDLLKIHTLALDILDRMGLKEQYEQRTRSHP